MPKVVPPSGLKEVSVTDSRGRQRVYKADRQGFINVSDSVAKQLNKEGIPTASTGGVAQAAGYPCNACGFSSWFRKCSRCGAESTQIEMDGSSSVECN